jgi:parvulin-like peptidyl-prolyl isomerase
MKGEEGSFFLPRFSVFFTRNGTMKFKLPLLLLLVLPSTFVCAQVASHAPTALKQPPAQASGDNPVARVNGVALTQSDLVREEYAIFPYVRQHGGDLPKELEPQIRAGALRMIVFEELVYQEALRRKMTIPVARMQRAQADFQKQFASPEEFNAFLAGDFHGSQQLLTEKIRRSLLIEALLKIEVENKSLISPVQLRAYYDNNAAQFDHPESYTFQTISILPPQSATPQQVKEGRTRADKALEQARTTKTAEQFGLLAEKLSDDDYRVVMGQHKPVPLDQLAPQVVAALKPMKPGNISGVIQIDAACTIIRLNQHTPAGKTPFLQVKAQLQKELHEKKRNQLRSAFDQKLRATAKVEEM